MGDDSAASRYGQDGRIHLDYFGPEVYNADPQTWGVTQDPNGLIYVASSDGVLIYDGVSWELVETPSGAIILSVDAGPDGRVYVGGVGELGYLEPDSLGQMQYVSLLDHLASEDRIFSGVRRTIVLSDGVYFQGQSRIMRFSVNGLSSWETGGLFSRSDAMGDTLYVHQPGLGLLQLKDNALTLVPGSESLADVSYLAGVVPREEGGFLAITRSNGLFLCDSAQTGAPACLPFAPATSEFLSSRYVSNILHRSDGTVMLGTWGHGVILMTEDGEILRVFDDDVELPQSTIQSLFEDRQGQVWFTTNNGLARLRHPSSMTSFDRETGLTGGVTDMLRHQGQLYASTSEGVFRLQPSTARGPATFVRHLSTREHCASLISTPQGGLAGCRNGVFDLENDRLFEDFTSNVVYDLHRSAVDTTRMYAALQNGLAWFDLVDGAWTYRDRIEAPVIIYRIAEDQAGTLWMSSIRNGVFRFDQRQGGAPHLSEQYSVEQGLPEAWYITHTLGGEVIFRHDDGEALYKPVIEGDTVRIERDPRFETFLHQEADALEYLHGDEEGRVWTFSSAGAAVAVPHTEGIYRVYPTILRTTAARRVYTMYNDGDDTLWMGGAHGATRVQKSKAIVEPMPYSVLIRRVATTTDSLIFGGYRQASLTQAATLPYDTRGLRFTYAAPQFDAPAATRYRTRLDGLDEDWSAWTDETRRDYMNLPPGHYRFVVQARNVYGMLSESAHYDFTILPPWYGTWWAYVLWVLLAGGGLIGLVLGYNRVKSGQLEARNRLLETAVDERTAIIEDQKTSLEAAYEEAIWANEDLSRSNRMLEERTGQLRDALEANKEILGITAHDLKNPLSGIIGLADVVLFDATEEPELLEPSVAEHVPMLKQEAQRMLRIVEELLDRHRDQMEQAALNKEPLDLGAVVSTVMRWNGKQAANKEIVLHHEVDDTIIVDADALGLQRVLDNYLSNAIKYSPLGSAVRVEAQPLPDAGGDAAPAWVRVAVIDEGPGLTEEDKKIAFSKMQRLSAKPTAGEHSSGLGLYIVKGIVEAHGGQVGVESSHGDGATFWFTMPLGTGAKAPTVGAGWAAVGEQTTSSPEKG
ncbi:MAG: ATP-binding protein [Bacteroidota bacterium]